MFSQFEVFHVVNMYNLSFLKYILDSLFATKHVTY